MYGESSALLRQALGELLRQHRVQQRIGGPGLHSLPATSTPNERELAGEQIGRYRHAVLIWCRDAILAASPPISEHANLSGPRGAAERLRRRLQAALDASETTVPDLGELTTAQPWALVEAWRHAARACALGEHDFGAGVTYRRLTEAQCLTVVRDASDVTRALVVLDRRYAKIPGWQALKDPGRLARAAEYCTASADYGEPDYTVDRRGHRPPPALIDGPGLPGVAGVLQAQHNLLIHLHAFPDARRLRIVLDSQRIVSSEAAHRLSPHDQDLAAHWERRADTYRRLIKETRDLGGIIGNGGPAAGQGSLAAVRMQKLATYGLSESTPTRRLARLSAQIDERVCLSIEHGIEHDLYVQRVASGDLDTCTGGRVKAQRVRYYPITSPRQTERLDDALRDLRLGPFPGKSGSAAQSRLQFEAALTHRPAHPGPSRFL